MVVSEASARAVGDDGDEAFARLLTPASRARIPIVPYYRNRHHELNTLFTLRTRTRLTPP